MPLRWTGLDRGVLTYHTEGCNISHIKMWTKIGHIKYDRKKDDMTAAGVMCQGDDEGKQTTQQGQWYI